jgi:hypothetical protein
VHQPLGPTDRPCEPIPLDYQGAPVPTKLNKLDSVPGSLFTPDPAEQPTALDRAEAARHGSDSSAMPRVLTAAPAPARPGRRYAPGRVSRVGLWLAAVLELAWVVQFVLPTGVPWPRQLFSDLEADGRPWAWLFRAAFDGADLLVIAVSAVLVVRCWRAQGPARWAWLALGVSGLAAVVDDGFAMTCVPGVSPACPLGTLPLHAPWIDQLHSVASCVAVLGMLASMAVLARRDAIARVLLTVELASTIAVGLTWLAGGPSGIPQAAELTTDAVWLVLLSGPLWSR